MKSLSFETDDGRGTPLGYAERPAYARPGWDPGPSPAGVVPPRLPGSALPELPTARPAREARGGEPETPADALLGVEHRPAHTAVQTYVYHDCATPDGPGAEATAEADADPSSQGERFAQERRRFESARQEGFNQAREQLWPEALTQAQAAMQAELERNTQALQQQVRQALIAFQRQREQYFCQLERDVVQLVLSIARKVLCREAQIDPLLLAGVVHVALEPVAVGVPVTLVVPPSSLAQWQELFARADRPLAAVQSDPALEPYGCRLETETGSTDLSLEAQLREIEQGFLDLLRRRTALAAHA